MHGSHDIGVVSRMTSRHTLTSAGFILGSGKPSRARVIAERVKGR